MDQSRAINALEPYIALSKTANTPRAAADVITQATSHPNTYVFAELLHMPNISALRDTPEYASHHRLLQIFSWGTYEDFQASTDLPKLSPQQHQKLLLLSLLPLARQQKNLTYPNLQRALGIKGTQELESLITTAIYTGLITATLDPRHQTVNITSVSPLRDLPPGNVPSLTQTLITWSQQCTSTLQDLESQVEAVRTRARAEGERRDKLQAVVDAKLSEEEKKSGKKGMQVLDEGFGDSEDAMDVDAGVGGKSRAQKRGFFSR